MDTRLARSGGGIMATQNNNSGGIGFFGLLGIVFITLKLLGYITWSWWWVLAPIWGPIALVLVMALLYACITLMK
jgi:hypothetical protein